MVSVTARANKVKQPYGGFLKPKEFQIVTFNDGKGLNENQNIHPSLIGLAVDYLTRFQLGEAKKDAFSISMMGATLINEIRYARSLLDRVKGLDDESIKSACKLSGYDTVFRAGKVTYVNVKYVEANKDTIKNIRIMVERSIAFFDQYGPVTQVGFVFPDAYTATITSGDGDYLTRDALWDIKTLRSKPNSKHTLQLMIYYMMGSKSRLKDEFRTIERIGIYNPRLNVAYYKRIEDIPTNVLEIVSKEVIGYA